MAVSVSQLTQLYLACFGRPPDLSGLAYYAGPEETLATVAAKLSASPESQSLYGASFGGGQIGTIYQVLFNRTAEPEGVAYWAQEVASGRLSPAMAPHAILLGAQNDDARAVQHKLQASAAFSASLDTAAEVLAYSGPAAVARGRAFLASVTSDAGTLEQAIRSLDEVIVRGPLAAALVVDAPFDAMEAEVSVVGVLPAEMASAIADL